MYELRPFFTIMLLLYIYVFKHNTIGKCIIFFMILSGVYQHRTKAGQRLDKGWVKAGQRVDDVGPNKLPTRYHMV